MPSKKIGSGKLECLLWSAKGSLVVVHFVVLLQLHLPEVQKQSGIMQGCLQLRYNLDYTRNRRRDLTIQYLFIHS